MSCGGAPVAPKVRLRGRRHWYVHPFAWLTANVWPPMMMLALRARARVGGHREIDRRRTCSAAGTPVIHAGTPLLVQLQSGRGVHGERTRAARGRRVVAGRVQRKTARRRGLRDGKCLAANGDVGVAGLRVGVGSDGEIDRRRTCSARRHARDPRRYAAAGPVTAGRPCSRRIVARAARRSRVVAGRVQRKIARPGCGLRDGERLASDDDVGAARAGSGLAATVKLIVVVPVPLAGTPVIHAGTPLLVQLQLAAVFTSTALAPPAAVALWLVGFNEKLHAAAPACVTAKVWPPMMMLALRDAGSGLAATVKLIVVVPCSARRHAGDPRRHAAARPVAAGRGVHVERAGAARGRRIVAGRIQRKTARRRGRLRDGEGLAADGDVGAARRGIGVGGDREIDRGRPCSARWHARDPRRHAAARPAAAAGGVDVERSSRRPRPSRCGWSGSANNCSRRDRRLRDGEGLAADDDVGVARARIGVGSDREIDRLRPRSARRHTGDPRGHAARRPAAAARGVHRKRTRTAAAAVSASMSSSGRSGEVACMPMPRLASIRRTEGRLAPAGSDDARPLLCARPGHPAGHWPSTRERREFVRLRGSRSTRRHARDPNGDVARVPRTNRIG